MKKFIAKTAAWVALSVLIFGQTFAQDKQQTEKPKEKTKPEKIRGGNEIIIKSKSNKDGKVTIEIKGGEVFINGKPVDEFQDDAIIVEKIQMPFGGDVFAYPPGSPFRRGGWNFSGEEFDMSNNAFLGVSSNKAEGGGAEITEVTKESAAEKIGLKKGDIITKIDEINVESPGDLVKAIHKYKPEDKVVVTYKRDGKEQKATATLGKSNFMWKSFNMPEINEDMDLIAPHIAPMPRGMYGGPRAYSVMTRGPKIGLRAQDLEDGKGVKVIDVDEDSPAEKAGIKEGDIITQFDGKNITSANELAELARANGAKSPVKMKITRAGKPMDIEVKIPKKLKTAEL